MLVIGIIGKLRSGKDTIAQHLVAQYGFTRIAFADALKCEVAATLRNTVLTILKGDTAWWVRYAGWVSAHGAGTSEDDMLHYGLHVDRVPAVRALLQEYGTELRRAEDPDYWVNRWFEQVERLPQSARVVVPDTRFPNEVFAVCGTAHWQGQLWRVVRPGFTGDRHSSETLLDGRRVDAEFSNVGDLADLEALVDVWCETAGISRIPPVPAGVR